MRFKIDWASLIVGSKFTVFALFHFVFEDNFPSTSPGRGGGLYLEGRFNGEFLVLPVWGLIFGGAYTWRGLFSEFCGIQDLTSLAVKFSLRREWPGRSVLTNGKHLKIP